MPVLQLTRRGLVWDDAHGPRLFDEFHQHQSVRLPAFLEPALVDVVLRGIERGEFAERRHEDFAVEQTMRHHDCLDLLHFLVNDERLFRVVERLAGSVPVRIFAGRIYRNLPARHEARWHSDTTHDREIGMSLNLSTSPYAGGVFEIRRADNGHVLNAIANVGLGDAFLFRISEALEHRVTPVEGSVPKTAFAGWFSTAPDYVAALRSNLPGRLRA
jgi:hypothetical protein